MGLRPDMADQRGEQGLDQRRLPMCQLARSAAVAASSIWPSTTTTP
jgi:hypothetical protein